MATSSAGLLAKTIAVLSKDIRQELRTRYALNAILMFGITTLIVVSFTIGQSRLSPSVLSAIFWIIIFFSAMAALAQCFSREEEAGTALILRLSADPTSVYLGKLIFNLVLMVIMAAIITPAFFMFTDAPVNNVLLFVLVEIFGIVGLCAATTIIAAIISRTSIKGPLFSVLSFPILILLLLLLVKASSVILDGGGFGEISTELQGLLAYAVVMLTASLMLFKFVWLE